MSGKVKYCKHCKTNRYCKMLVTRLSGWVFHICNKCKNTVSCE
jgi:hypothetical protein